MFSDTNKLKVNKVNKVQHKALKQWSQTWVLMKQPANVTNDKKFSIFHTGYLDVKDSICVSHLSYLVMLLFVFRVNFADLMPIKTLLMLENKQSPHSHKLKLLS